MFVLVALGSRGDVQPMASLANALTSSGHEASIVALADYESLAARLAPAAHFVPVPASIDDALDRSRFQDLLAQSMPGQYLLLKQWVSQLAESFAAALLATVGPGDTVVTGALTRGAAMACVAGLRCKLATMVYTGQLPTLRRESFIAPQYFSGWEPYDRWGSRLSWELSTSLGNALTTAVGRRLGLPHKGFRAVTRLADEHPIILAASPLLIPTAPDWPATTRQTGYLAPPAMPFNPDPELQAFLRRRPVFIGFGSFTQFTMERDTEAILTAAESTGRPVLTLARPGLAAGPVTHQVFAIDHAPFDQLFTEVAATIHHGGAGTSHEAIRSGRPTATIPFGVDQPLHAHRLHALGLGPSPGRLDRHGLQARELARLIDALTGPDADRYAEQAHHISRMARAERGLEQTLRVLTH